MVINGSLKPSNYRDLIQGNPDTQPVRTFEIVFLVKIALFLSGVINRRYEDIMKKYYNLKHNFFSILLRQVLSPPVKYVCYKKSTNNLGTEMMIENLPPRVNLRFIASIEFLFYLSIIVFLLFLLNLFNYSPISVLLLLCSTTIFYICIKSTFVYVKEKNE